MKKLLMFFVAVVMMTMAAQTYGQSVTITPAAPTICSGQSVTLTANPVGAGLPQYSWSNGGTSSSTVVTPLTTTIYTVTVTWIPSMIQRTASVTVTVNSAPTATITATGPTTFCSGGSVTFNSSTTGGVTSYQWRLGGVPISGANAASYTASTAGNYDLVVNNGACSGTSTALSVTVNPLPPATVTPNGPQQICFGSTIVLTANAGYTYQWQNSPSGLTGTWTSIPGATNQTYNINTTGWYRVRTTDLNGCQNYSN